MALLAIDSFDHFSTAQRAYKGWTFASAGASAGDEGCTIGAFGRNSTNGVRCRNGAVSGVSGPATLGVSNTSGATAGLGVGFRINTAVPSTDFVLFSFKRGSTPLITVTCSATGTLSVRRGDRTDTILATSVSTVTHSTYYFAELKVVLNDSTGTYELKIDGATFASGSGADTLVSGAATWDGVTLGSPNVGVNLSIDFDDLHVYDGSGGSNDDFMGDHRIVCVVASSGNGGNTDWSPSTGSDHGALVDENPANTTDYNRGSSAGQRDTYNFAALGVSGTVKAVQAVNLLSAEVAGVRSVGAVVRQSSTNYDSTGQSIGSDWLYYKQLHLADPSTSTAWTTSGVDSAEFGVKVTA